MSTTFPIILNLAAFIAILLLLFWMQKKYFSFAKRVFSALGLGVLFGLVLHFLYSTTSHESAVILKHTIEYTDIIGTGYVKLLKMIIMPLIMVSLISAIIKLKGADSIGKISALSIGTLVGTTVIAALVGIVVAHLFGLNAEGMTAGAAEIARGEALLNTNQSMGEFSLPKMIIAFIPENPFQDIAGLRSTSTIAVVIFSIFIGISAMGIAKKKPELFASFEYFMQVAQAIVMRLVTIVLRLTPYGVAALMAKMVAISEFAEIAKLISFVAASYVALIIMFGIHLIIVTMTGLNPVQFVKKIIPVLIFAFTSRSSAASIPFNIRTQTQGLGISDGVANFSASFGATIGQNGCGGIYPAMLAFMIAPTMGVDPWSLGFILPLLIIIAISSFGVAGVGGGATFAALIVLSAMDYPVALAGLLIAIEPLIDMGRTALNVSGSITAGTVTARVMGEMDTTVFNGSEQVQLDSDASTNELN
jgi:L-cystine uptake protein TcyP (sodium:dicarboxylate symporter family)